MQFLFEVFCSLKESIITWIPNDIIDECPYDRLLYTDLSVDGNNVLIDSKNSLLFKVNGLETLKCQNYKRAMIQLTFQMLLFMVDR